MFSPATMFSAKLPSVAVTLRGKNIGKYRQIIGGSRIGGILNSHLSLPLKIISSIFAILRRRKINDGNKLWRNIVECTLRVSYWMGNRRPRMLLSIFLLLRLKFVMNLHRLATGYRKLSPTSKRLQYIFRYSSHLSFNARSS